MNYNLFTFQINMLLTMVASDTSEEDMKDSFLFFRLARCALVADPWVYVLLRREIIVCFFFKRQERPPYDVIRGYSGTEVVGYRPWSWSQ